MNQEPGVVSIQSQLVFGHAGNSAAVLPLERAGIPVSPVPTVLYSNTPHYPSLSGDVLPPDNVRALLAALLERQPPSHVRAVISGYLGAAGMAGCVAGFVREVKAGNPEAIYVLDPVIGSREVGDVADAETFAAIRDQLLPLADIVVPNDYELYRLTGRSTATPAAAEEAARELIGAGAAEVVVTGIGDPEAGTLDCIAVSAAGAWGVATPRLPVQPVGTGDVLTALYTAARLRAEAPAAALATAVSGRSPWSRACGNGGCANCPWPRWGPACSSRRDASPPGRLTDRPGAGTGVAGLAQGVGSRSRIRCQVTRWPRRSARV